ncbi:MAG: LytTR family DNA-binding domain-containing protein [Clostridiales bacterium]
MNIKLLCSEKNFNILSKLLKEKNFIINDDCDITIVEDGFSTADNNVHIVFNTFQLETLIEFINNFNSFNIITENLILGKKNDVYELINLDKITYFESQGNNVFFRINSNKYLVKYKLYELESQFENKGFIRISKSYIVNIKNIKNIVPWFNSKILLKLMDNSEIEVSKKYLQKFKTYIGY